MKNIERTKTGLMLLGAALLAAGCVIGPESEADPVDAVEETETTTNWTEGLTRQEIIESMPAWVEAAGVEEDEAAVENNIGVSTHALGCYAKPVVKYCLPKVVEFYDAENDEMKTYNVDDFKWRIWVKNFFGDSWQLITPIINSILYGNEYIFSFEDEPLSDGQTIRYYKLENVDDLNGVSYDTVVTFAVSPNSNPIRVTLSDETDAAATSDLLLNGAMLWQDINQQPTPQTQTLVEGTVSPCIPINFQIQTDFTGWDFGPYEFPHTSNSTFCKVTVEDPTSADVAQRIKYKFEDLPISQVSVENGHKFDYDDVVVYVDLLK